MSACPVPLPAAVNKMTQPTRRNPPLQSNAAVQRARLEPTTKAQAREDVIPIEIVRTKPLSEITAADIPPGLYPEDIATDYGRSD